MNIFEDILKEQDEEKRNAMIYERLLFLDATAEQDKMIDVNTRLFLFFYSVFT